MSWLEEAALSLDSDQKEIKEIKQEKKKVKKNVKKKVAKSTSKTKLSYVATDDVITVKDDSYSMTKNVGDFIYEFTNELLSRGFDLGADSVRVTVSESPNRVDIEGCKANSKPGWYYFKVLGDAAFGTFGDWRNSSVESWSSFSESKPNEAKMAKARRIISKMPVMTKAKTTPSTPIIRMNTREIKRSFLPSS